MNIFSKKDKGDATKESKSASNSSNGPFWAQVMEQNICERYCIRKIFSIPLCIECYAIIVWYCALTGAE